MAGRLTGVGETAIRAARVRVRETRRPDRLFDDPYAAAFVSAASTPASASAHLSTPGPPDARREGLAHQVVIRTRFFDEYLVAGTGAGCLQVVLLAAGLDARAFRLNWPSGVRLFEVDLPDVLAFKAAALAAHDAAPGCDRTVVAADLRGSWAAVLTRAGFQPTLPTAWLAEGLLAYLDVSAAVHVLTTVAALSVPGSRLGLERGDAASSFRAGPAGASTGAVTDLWKGGLGEPAEHWLGRHGWRAEGVDIAALSMSYGRPAPAPTHSGLVTATYLGT